LHPDFLRKPPRSVSRSFRWNKNPERQNQHFARLKLTTLKRKCLTQGNLPPARLPPWDGKRETLLKAVMAVTPPKATPKTSAASQRKGREALDAAYDFRPTDDKTSAPNAPFAAYWHPTAPQEALPVREYLSTIAPALYRPGEAFMFHAYWAHDGQSTANASGGHIDLWNGSRLTISGFWDGFATFGRYLGRQSFRPGTWYGYSDLSNSKVILFWAVQ
jgi:hypothetical protein